MCSLTISTCAVVCLMKPSHFTFKICIHDGGVHWQRRLVLIATRSHSKPTRSRCCGWILIFFSCFFLSAPTLLFVCSSIHHIHTILILSTPAGKRGTIHSFVAHQRTLLALSETLPQCAHSESLCCHLITWTHWSLSLSLCASAKCESKSAMARSL